MHSVKDGINIAPQSGYGTRVARESGQSKERDRGSKGPGAVHWSEHEKSEKNRKYQSETANPSEACIGKYRPRSSLSAYVSERLAKDVRGEPDDPHRTG